MQDRLRWDERYANQEPAAVGAIEPPGILALHADAFPTTGHALDLACGQGFGAVWLAHRGLDVWALDISPVAIGQARDLAERSGVGDRCRFDVVDLDDGLPVGPWPDGPALRAHALIASEGPGSLRAHALIDRSSCRMGPGSLRAHALIDRSSCRMGPGSLRAHALIDRSRAPT